MSQKQIFETKFGLNGTDAEKRHTDFQTPINVCEYMVSMVPPGTKTVLEPTPGIGNILSRLDGYQVTAPKDFFTMPRSKWDCIVMNPPFSSKSAFMENAPADFEERGMRLGYYFLTECMNMSDEVIALMPWFTISNSDVRLRYLRDYGIKSITALPRKTFQYARIQTCVLQLSKGFKGDTLFKVFS